jgi:hypothetical protein
MPSIIHAWTHAVGHDSKLTAMFPDESLTVFLNPDTASGLSDKLTAAKDRDVAVRRRNQSDVLVKFLEELPDDTVVELAPPSLTVGELRSLNY